MSMHWSRIRMVSAQLLQVRRLGDMPLVAYMNRAAPPFAICEPDEELFSTTLLPTNMHMQADIHIH
eukprot:scaffold227810_cov20-Tisochrysis_lutea.AAC.1